MKDAFQHHRSGRTYWPVLGFLVGAVVILLLALNQFLVPVIRLSRNLGEGYRRPLAAISAMVLAIVLLALLAWFILVVRPGRFFLPRKNAPRSRTRYVDAWSESARRLETPPPEDMEPPEKKT